VEKIRDEHLDADKTQDGRKAIVQEMKEFHQAGDGEEKRTQSQDGKDIGGVNDKRISGNRQNRRDGINRKQDIGGFQRQQNGQHRRSETLSIFNDEKSGFLKFLGYRNEITKHFDRNVFLRMDFRFFVERHFDAGENQKRAENVHDPVEFVDERNAGKNKCRARNQRQQDAPEERLVLISGRHVEKPEDQQEHKKIINAQRVFNDVSGKKFQRLGVAVKIIDARAEQAGQCDPEGCPEHGFLHFDDVHLAVENTQIQGQHRQDKDTENCPPEGHL